MTRFIPVRESADGLPDRVHIQPGDVLWVTAVGARVRSGTAVEVLGILQEAVLGTDGRALAPMGTPNVVLLQAQQPGQSDIDLVTGDPWHSARSRTITVIVQP